jgi:hypothetical protein
MRINKKNTKSNVVKEINQVYNKIINKLDILVFIGFISYILYNCIY